MLLTRLFGLRPLFFFDGDSGGAGGGTQNPGNTNGNGTGGGEATQTLTQAQLNALFAERADQAKRSTMADVLKELGVENLDAVKNTLKAAKDAEAAQLTELQKAQAKAEAEAKAKAEAETKALQAIELANTRLMQSAVMIEAAKAEHRFNPEALADVWAFVDRSKLAVKDDGTVEGIADAVKAVAKAKPYMVVAEQQQKPAPGTPPGRKQTAGQGQQQQNQGQQQQKPAQTVRF